MRGEPRYYRLWHTFNESPLRSESGYAIEEAFPADYRDSGQRNRPDYPFAYIVAKPDRHVVISPLPLNTALLIPNLSQPFDEVINVRSAREGQDCFDVGDTVESIEGSREHFDCICRANQRIWFVGRSKEMAGENVYSVTSGTVRLRFR